MFEKAIRLKLRFNFRGELTIEDLYDLDPEKNLSEMYEKLDLQLQPLGRSLSNKKNPKKDEIELKMQIIKYVYDTLMTERLEKANKLKAKQDQMEDKEYLAELRRKKKFEKYDSLTLEEIETKLHDN